MDNLGKLKYGNYKRGYRVIQKQYNQAMGSIYENDFLLKFWAGHLSYFLIFSSRNEGSDAGGHILRLSTTDNMGEFPKNHYLLVRRHGYDLCAHWKERFAL